MKKLLAALLTLSLILTLAACTAKAPPETSAPSQATAPTEGQSESLPTERYFDYFELADGLYQTIDPTEDMLLIQSLFDNTDDDITPSAISIEKLSDKDSFEYHTTLPFDRNIEAYRCATPFGHSPIDVVFLRTPAGGDMDAICDHAKENLNPRKEVCMIYDYTYILATETTALFVMGNGELPEQVQAAYLEKFPEATQCFFCSNNTPTT